VAEVETVELPSATTDVPEGVRNARIAHVREALHVSRHVIEVDAAPLVSR
jgi:hypothetical protein